jgi:hypothetical protein
VRLAGMQALDHRLVVQALLLGMQDSLISNISKACARLVLPLRLAMDTSPVTKQHHHQLKQDMDNLNNVLDLHTIPNNQCTPMLVQLDHNSHSSSMVDQPPPLALASMLPVRLRETKWQKDISNSDSKQSLLSHMCKQVFNLQLRHTVFLLHMHKATLRPVSNLRVIVAELRYIDRLRIDRVWERRLHSRVCHRLSL